MNQILDYGDDEQNTSINQEELQSKPKKMEDYYTKEPQNNFPQMNYSQGPKSNKQTIKFFAIALGIFAIVAIIIAIGIFYITNKEKKNLLIAEEIKPMILIVENENELQVTAEYEGGNLEKLVYTWDENPDQVVPGTGTNTITVAINKPVGTHKLKITVLAQDGKEAFEEKEYIQEKGVDIEKPKIEFSTTDTKKLKISIRDNVEIKSFKYFWNEESPTELSEARGRTEASIELEIKEGRNKITVIVEDGSGNITTEEKEYTGVVAPEIKLIQTSDRKKVLLTVTHTKGIKEINYKLNGKEYKDTYEGELVKTEKKFEIILAPGDNIIEVEAISIDGETATAKGSAKAPLPSGSAVLNTQN